MKRSPLPRHTPLRRSGPLRRLAPMRSTSARQRTERRAAQPVVAAVLARDGGLCRAKIAGVCAGRGTHAHHVLMRSQGGPDTVENLICVCALCHRYIHDHPAWSYERGLLRRSAP